MNGTPIQEDGTYNEQVVLTVRGTDLFGSHYGVYRIADGERVEYTPLGGTYDAPEYILMNNGVYEIMANGEVVRTLMLSGVEVIAKPFSRIMAGFRPDTTIVSATAAENYTITNDYFMNYPYKVSEEYPWFMVGFFSNPLSVDSDYTIRNAEVGRIFNAGSPAKYFWLRPINESSPVVVLYKGVIVFVGNYTN